MADITIGIWSILNLTILITLVVWMASFRRKTTHLEESIKKLIKNLHEVESENARLHLRIASLEEGSSDETD